jgi:hypothetical protein
MKVEEFHDRLQVGLIPGVLLLLLMFFAAGCVYYPDFVHPVPHRALANPLTKSIVNEMPFSVTRTPQANKDGSLKAEFEWEKTGESIWFKEFGFGTTAAKWRFVLFGPDGTVICGNDWQDTDVATKDCPIAKEQMGVPLSADIDFRFAGESEENFRSVGRVFYFVHPENSPMVNSTQ